MSTNKHLPDDIETLFRTLPEVEDSGFSNTVIKRTRLIQRRHSVLRALAALSVTTLVLFALPWQTLLVALTGSVDSLIPLSAEPLLLAQNWSQWLEMSISWPELQLQQALIVALLMGILGSVLAMTIIED
tara:strand:+ start:12770 stop:13159 length:390 start_codon:yes stop_codon:yes gene_type:complete